jgi:hypothetical protein
LRKFKSKIDPRYQKNSDEKKQRKNREWPGELIETRKSWGFMNDIPIR